MAKRSLDKFDTERLNRFERQHQARPTHPQDAEIAKDRTIINRQYNPEAYEVRDIVQAIPQLNQPRLQDGNSQPAERIRVKYVPFAKVHR